MNVPLWLCIVIALLLAVICGVIAFLAGVSHRKKIAEATIGSAEQEAKRIVSDAIKSAEAKKKEMISNGTLYCAGMIAGEGLVGILMAVLAIIKVGDNSIGDIIGGLFNLSGAAGNIVGLIVLALMILSLLKFSVWSKTKSK